MKTSLIYAVGSPDYPAVSGLNLSFSLFLFLPSFIILLFVLDLSISLSPSRARARSLLLCLSRSHSSLPLHLHQRDPRRYNRTTTIISGALPPSPPPPFPPPLRPPPPPPPPSASRRGPRGPRSSLIQSNKSRSSIRHTRRRNSLYSVCFPRFPPSLLVTFFVPPFPLRSASRGRPGIFEKATSRAPTPIRATQRVAMRRNAGTSLMSGACIRADGA